MFCACAVTVTTSPKSKTRPAFLNRFSIKSSSAHLSGRRKAKSNKETCTFGMGFEDRLQKMFQPETDRKSTRLNSSHVAISYAVFCLKKKKKKKTETNINQLTNK